MVDLIGVVLQGFKDAVSWFTSLFLQGLKNGYNTLSAEIFGTPTPQTNGAFVFGEPTNAPWKSIQHALVGGEIMIVSLLLLVLCVQGRHLIRIFNIGSTYESRRTRKTAWVGAFLIITWYWISVLTLYLVNGFTIALLPSLETLGQVMARMIGTSLANPALSLIFGMLGGLSMWALEALYYIREVLLYVYIYGMPIAFALAYGNVPVLSDVAMGFSKRFVPLAILPLPAAVVFKGYDLLYTQNSLVPSDPFLSYIVAVSLPLVAVVVTWKTFQYATPLTAKAISTAGRGAALVGGVAAGAYVGSASVATTAARWGPKAAAGQAVAEHASRRASSEESEESAPSYRRTENDPQTR